MKRYLMTLLAASSVMTAVNAEEGLYYIGSEAQESLPLKWMVGANLIYDDNVTPTNRLAGGSNQDAISISPYVGLSFVNITPQSTLDVYARFGIIYYLDSVAGSDDSNGQIRVGVNWTRRFTERLRFSSRNYIAYELEPDYAYGVATSRASGAYLMWGTDNSIGFRWTERFATYTGLSFSGVDYESSVQNSDRINYGFYNQFRYQLSPQTVITTDYRYTDTVANSLSYDSASHFLLLGLEHRFSPNTVIILKSGAQFKSSDGPGGSNNTSPYVELVLRSNVNDQFTVRAFTRYGIEVFDTTRNLVVPPAVLLFDFDDKQTLRFGVKGDYKLSPDLSLFAGVDYISADFGDGRQVFPAVPPPSPTVSGLGEDLINAYIGVTMQFTDYMYGSLSYNYTDSDSDIFGYTYDRNRISLGIHATF